MVKNSSDFFCLGSGIPKPQQPLRKPKKKHWETGGGKWWIHRIHPDSTTIQVMGKIHFISCAISGVPGVWRHNWTGPALHSSPLPKITASNQIVGEISKLTAEEAMVDCCRWASLQKNKMAWYHSHGRPSSQTICGPLVNFEMLVLLDGL